MQYENQVHTLDKNPQIVPSHQESGDFASDSHENPLYSIPHKKGRLHVLDVS